jgi:hypothetical protein
VLPDAIEYVPFRDFKVTSSQVAPKGIICVTYQRDGDVKTGAPLIKEDDQ